MALVSFYALCPLNSSRNLCLSESINKPLISDVLHSESIERPKAWRKYFQQIYSCLFLSRACFLIVNLHWFCQCNQEVWSFNIFWFKLILIFDVCLSLYENQLKQWLFLLKPIIKANQLKQHFFIIACMLNQEKLLGWCIL